MGFVVELDGDSVSWTWEGTGQPDPITAKPLLEELKGQKAAVLEFLRQEEIDSSDVVHIHSRLLDTDLWVVPDGWVGELDGPVYTDSEIRHLDKLNVTPDELRLIHAAKMAIDGELKWDCQF